MLVVIVILFLLISFFYYKFLKVKDYWLERGVPFIKPLPIVGNMCNNLLKKLNVKEFIIDIYNTYPTKRYFGIFQFHLPTLIIRDPELIKTIFVKEFASFSDHSMFNRGICEPYEGLFLITAKKGWHNLRTILSPSFTNAKLKCMFKLVDECGNSFVDYFKKLGEVPVDLKDSFSRYTNDAILTTAFGVKCESFKDKDNLILTVGKRMVDFTGIKGLKAFSYNISPFLTKLFNVQVVNEKNGKVFANIVEETLKLRKEKNIVRPDMINLMLETKAKMKTDSNEFKDQHNLELTNKDITAAAISFYFAGFDTTSTTLTFIAYELCVNPDVQNKLRAEIDETMARCNGELTFETVMNVKYLEMVIEETLRIWSPAVFMDRLCVRTFTIQPVNPDEKPLTLHPGDNIWLPIAGLHHDSKYYDNPERFDPERFSDENKSKRHPFSYMPFGGGPRTCIGNRYALFVCKLLLIKIIHNFELVPCEKTQIPLQITGILSVLPDKGVWLAFKPRSTQRTE